MAFGLGRLRLSPDAFWAMTPRELAAAAQPFAAGPAPPDRDRLACLLASYPDEVRHGR
jgi:uncharacterized phage protein (TIGR02216 family)